MKMSAPLAPGSGIEPYTGYVAFLDVLGFRELVGRPDSQDRLTQYIGSVDRAIQAAGPEVLQYVVFSDSVVINSRAGGLGQLEAILRACSTIFRELLRSRIPVRGAIAHGSFLRSNQPNGTFVAGRPIVQAYDYQERQNWVGIMLAPSVF